MQLLSQLFILLVVAVLSLKLYVSYRQVQAIKHNINQVPQRFSQTITLSDHQKAGNYNLAKLKLGTIDEVIASILVLLFTLGGGIQLINNVGLSWIQSPLTQGVMVIAIYSVIGAIINLPLSIYATFGIEQRFGFNKTSIGLFILDLTKGLGLAIIIGIPLLYLILWLMNIMGEYWWIWVWTVLIIFNLLILFIYPTFIAPLFNKFSLLTDEKLNVRITQLLAKCGFKSRGVFVMDGSKRSSHGNAYFTGIGKAKRIVFFDTLMQQLSHEEIEAILAHELGHFKKKHILKQMLLSFLLNLIVLYILSLLIKQPNFYHALGVSNINNYNGLILFILLIGLVAFPFKPLFSYFSRKNEFEADAFAKEYANKEFLISGLVKLYRDNAATLTPDPLYVKFYYSHPPASIRIKQLEELA